MTPLFAFQVFGSIAMVGAVLVTVWLPAVRRWRTEAPLREEIRAHPEASFRTQVAVKVPVFSGVVLPLRGDLDLAVRGDLIEIRQRAWVSRHVLGQEYCFRARDTSIEVGRSNFRPWIIIRSGQPGSGQPGSGPVWISRRDQLDPIWDALVAAGAQPASSPPQMLPTR
jgi:hypothetical protein